MEGIADPQASQAVSKEAWVWAIGFFSVSLWSDMLTLTVEEDWMGSILSIHFLVTPSGHMDKPGTVFSRM